MFGHLLVYYLNEIDTLGPDIQVLFSKKTKYIAIKFSVRYKGQFAKKLRKQLNKSIEILLE